MLKLTYLPSQEQVFFPVVKKRFTVVTKGRRVGLTRGAAMAFVEQSLGKKSLRILWGETIFSNVSRYIDLYFMPVLKQLPASMWSWQSKMMQLHIGESLIDFRSADNPENWEGFGYDIIFLNEAGIILRNPDLYKKTVLPMMLDYADSQLIAAGVPKGKKLKSGEVHPFYELWEKAATNPSYARYRFSSHSNVYLDPENIKEIEETLDEKMRLQEIYGEFIDITDNPYLYTFDAGTHVIQHYEPSPRLPIWISFDFNVDPNSALVSQQPTFKNGIIFDEISVKGHTDLTCDQLIAKYSHWINRGLVFITGDATGRNRTAVSGELTNYKVIKARLKLTDSQMKVKTSNSFLDASRVLCNSILAKGDVRITENCRQLITDCQIASVDGGGDLIKDSGMHKLDCFRYQLEAWFPDFLDKEYKYVTPPKPSVNSVTAVPVNPGPRTARVLPK